ncbi:fibrous sheath-interacting protein 1 isoform X2 [Dunckerocampus dactyliophorus]|uniref:fibrous sheath-interacting protein 1 isoform X2 n=1 Tax=Dunckerocampus dactyliophorus TaxID=161453 RepID=UPI0024071E98|nr:fibrous sheath-interacting protein 1 isoform X2 [Dunckerocampus dactyliophorus]
MTERTIMEMTTGNLENTSRPASAESSANIHRGQFDINATDEEKQDPELRKAIEEMRRLDEILSTCMCRLKKAKRQRKELQAQLWQELKERFEGGRSESSHEAMSARLFLALEAPIGPPVRDDFVSVFQTQLSDCEVDRRLQRLLESEEGSDNWSKASESVCEETTEGSHGEAAKAKKKEKNFVKRNIEENMWALPVSTSEGYTQGNTDLERLSAIDAELRVFQPVVELPSPQSSSYTLLNEECGSDIGPKRDCDAQPGEKVLQDIKERRTHEMQLQEIQRQLDLLGQDQEMTSESEALSEQQLLSLLDACELTESEPGP